LSRGCQYRMAS